MILPKNVTIIEVGARDGLQNEKVFVPTEIKKQFIEALRQAGFTEMELTSFVSPKWVPQMQDAAEIARDCIDESIRNFILIPNKKGMERLYATNGKDATVFVGVSDTFNKRNINKTTKESLQDWGTSINQLKADGYFVRASISTAFYCPFEGKIPEEKVLEICYEFIQLGVDELSVADTIGMASPTESYSLFKKLKTAFPNVLLTAHFHDTRKMGLANVLAALQAGIDRFDCSAGGLGGCPFAPGASGNVATEDVVYMLERMGISTGISLDKLVSAIEFIEPHISRKIESGYYRLQKGNIAVN